MRNWVVRKRDGCGNSQVETDVGAIRAVALVPGIVQRDFVFPVSSRDVKRSDPGRPVVKQLGRATVRLPVTGTTNFGLQAADQSNTPWRVCVTGLGRRRNQASEGDQTYRAEITQERTVSAQPEPVNENETLFC